MSGFRGARNIPLFFLISILVGILGFFLPRLGITFFGGNLMFLSSKQVVFLVFSLLGGSYWGRTACSGSVLAFSLTKYLHAKTLVALFNGIPTFFGCAMMHVSRRCARIAFLIGAFFFLIHPIGSQAYVYPVIWAIPFFATYVPGSLAQLCIGTFSTHMMGSLIWLYGGCLVSPVIWRMLPPIVLVERCIMISLAAVLFYLLSTVCFWLRRSRYAGKYISLFLNLAR